MTMLQDLATLLESTLAGDKVYPVVAPDAPVPPYIVYFVVASNAENVMSGDSGLVNTRVQVDVYARSYGDARAIALQIDQLMAAWSVQNVSLLSQDGYEDDVKLFRVTTDFSVWHTPPL